MTDQERPITDDDLRAYVDGILDPGRRRRRVGADRPRPRYVVKRADRRRLRRRREG